MNQEEYCFKINKIILKNNQIIEPKKINIIVGPNNAGKSRFLKDIKNIITNTDFNSEEKNLIIDKLEYELPKNKDEFIKRYNLETKIIKRDSNSWSLKSYFGAKGVIDGTHDFNSIFDNNTHSFSGNWEEHIETIINNLNKIHQEDQIVSSGKEEYEVTTYSDGSTTRKLIGGYGEAIGKSKEENIKSFIFDFGKLFLAYLGTEEKLMLCKKQENFGITDDITNFLSSMKNNSKALKELSNHTINMFKKDILLDTTTMGRYLAFRVGNDFSYYRNIKKTNTDKDFELAKESILDDEGDGLKNFTTTFMTLKSEDKNIILIDEPESFLHPPLARRMGEIIAKTATNEKQIFISTHSEDILNGIISKTSDVNIIRITRDGNTNKINIMDKKEIQKIKKTPLLIASNIFKGLFSEKVYITESFADTMIYQQIGSKVDEFSSIYFVNTQGKDKIADVISFYDKLEVNNIAIYDFDYFRQNSTIKNSLYYKIGSCKNYEKVINFSKELELFIKKIAQSKVKDSSSEKIDSEEQNKKIKLEIANYYHSMGINCLNAELKEKCEEVIKILKENNIIVLKNGCLETTLTDLEIKYTTDKNAWLENATELIEQTDKEDLEKTYLYQEIFGHSS